MDVPEDLKAWPGHVGNWGRWPNDRGALNLMDSAAVLRGLAAARQGHVIACSRKIQAHDPIIPEPVFSHQMISAGKVPFWPEERKALNASDKASFWVHGMVNTHIDAFAHVGYKGYAFNGIPFPDVVGMEEGAKRLDITSARAIVSRGVFVDVPRRRGIDYIQPGDWVTPDDLADVAERIEPGDVVVIRIGGTLATGRAAEEGKDVDSHGTWPGLHGDCIDLLGRKGAAVIATDGPGDVFPSPQIADCESPVHVLSLVFWGMHLVHNMDLEELGRYCAAEGRDDFLFMVNAVNAPRMTGSLTTPIAVL